MEVGGTARIAGQFAEQDVGIFMGSGEFSPVACNGYLIRLLVVLAAGIIVGYLCWQCIIGYSLQIIGPLDVTGYFQHFFQ